MICQRAFLPILFLIVGPSLLLFGYGPSDPGSRPDGLATIAPRSIPLDAAVSSYTISPDNRTLAALVRMPDERQMLRIYDLATCNMLSEKEGSLFPQSMEFSPDGKKLACMYRNQGWRSPPYMLQLWNLTAERQSTLGCSLEPDQVHFGTILFQCSFSPDGNALAAGTRDEVIYLWETTTGKLKLRFQGGVAASFSADGKTLFGVSVDGFIRQFDAATGRHLGPAEPAQRADYLFVSHAVFATDGRLAALGDGHAVLVKETRTNRTLCRIDLPDDAAPLGFTADGRTLAVTSERGTHFIDTATGRERAWVQRDRGYRHFAGIDKYCPHVAGKSIQLHTTTAVLARGQRPPLPPKTEPLGVTLEADLTVVQDTYALDLEGNTREEFVTRINYGEEPDTPRMDLLLTLRNTGREKITLKYPDDQPSLHLSGCGTLNPWAWVQVGVGGGPERRGPLTLAPGQTNTVRVTCLDEAGSYHYWVLPGEYSISGYLHTSVFPAPKGVLEPSADGSGWVTIRCAPAKVRVIEVAGPLPRRLDDVPPISRPPALGSAAVVQPVPDPNELRWKLATRVNLESGIEAGTPLKDIVAFINDRFDRDIRFDSAGFKAVGKENFAETKTGLAPLKETSLSVALNLLLDSVDAGLEIRQDAIWIVPLAQPKSLVERLELADKHYRNHLKKSIDVRNRIPPGTTLKKALEVVGDHSELTIVLDVRAFERAGIKDIGRQPVQFVDSGEEPVNIILDKLLRQVNAAFSARERAVIVFPRK